MNKRMVSWTIVLGLCAAAATLPGGCDKKKKEKKRTGKPRIALIMKSLANEFFKTMEDGAKAHQEAYASQYDLIVNGLKDEQDVAGQIKLVEEMIGQEVHAIVIAPADSKALVPVCKKAQDAGIVVINIDNKLDAKVVAEKNTRIPFVGPNNREGARMAGEYLAAKLKKGDEVAIVEGAPNAYNSIQRKLGFEDAMKAAGMVIVSSQTGKWESAPAEKVVAGMATQHKDLKAVLCANDSMALGAVAALKSVGKLDKIQVIGYDNISAVQELMKEGRVLCTIDQHADEIAVGGIELALTILGVLDKDTPVERITADSLK